MSRRGIVGFMTIPGMTGFSIFAWWRAAFVNWRSRTVAARRAAGATTRRKISPIIMPRRILLGGPSPVLTLLISPTVLDCAPTTVLRNNLLPLNLQLVCIDKFKILSTVLHRRTLNKPVMGGIRHIHERAHCLGRKFRSQLCQVLLKRMRRHVRQE